MNEYRYRGLNTTAKKVLRLAIYCGNSLNGKPLYLSDYHWQNNTIVYTERIESALILNKMSDAWLVLEREKQLTEIGAVIIELSK